MQISKGKSKAGQRNLYRKLCESIENCQKQNKSREVYEGVRKLTGKHVPRINAVKDKQGKLQTDEQKVSERWKEYFEELYTLFQKKSGQIQMLISPIRIIRFSLYFAAMN